MTNASYHVRIRKREIILSPADQIAYADGLVGAFPDVRFCDIPHVLPKNEQPPEIAVRSLAECRCEDVFIVFDPAWRPRWNCAAGVTNNNRWYIDNIPLPNARFERGRGIRRRERYKDLFDGEVPESIGSGRIYYRIASNDKAQESLARKALGLIGKVASNKNLMLVESPSLKVIRPEVRSEWWVGNDARRWCLEKPTRSLGGMAQPGGAWTYRPKPG